MSILVGKEAPDFSEKAVFDGQVKENFTLSQFKGKYVVLFFYPLDFTFVCPTELHAFQEKLEEFKIKEVEIVGVSTDSWFSHLAWLDIPQNEGGIRGIEYPLVADFNKNISRDYGVLLDGGMSLRATFLIDKNQVVQHQAVNNLDLGRSVNETMRMVDTLQYTEEHGEVCPANWQDGDKAMKASQEGVKKYFK